MARWKRNFMIGIAAAVLLLGVLSTGGVLDYDVWVREQPLRSTTAVTSVHDGTILLADGRAFRPAGVRRLESVAVEDFDNALRVMIARGVVVIRDVGDGTAFLLAEPKFYNACGTRGMDGNPWKRWAGSYFQCPMSELLIHVGYAAADLAQDGLTKRELWRLEGVQHCVGVEDHPRRISLGSGSFRYGGVERCFHDYEGLLETMWKPAPQ
jgi:hypothetical protein